MPPEANEKYKVFLWWMWIIDIATHNLPHSLCGAGGVSHISCKARKWEPAGRAALSVPPCSSPLVSWDAEFLAGKCTWAACWYSPQLRCLSIDVHLLTCMNRHTTLIIHLMTSCLVRPWLSLTMVSKWDSGAWGLRNDMKVVPLCSTLPLFLVIVNLPHWKLVTSVNLSHACWEVVGVAGLS